MLKTPTPAAQAALSAEIARLLPHHDLPFNYGWLACTHGLPNVPPADCIQPEGWELGWQTAAETPSLYWPWVKNELLSPV